MDIGNFQELAASITRRKESESIHIHGSLYIYSFGFVDDNKVKVAEIASVRLECADICKDPVNTPAPFVEKTFDDAGEINTFVKAINKAEKMNGELGYAVYFHMYISFKNGAQKKYVLNISNLEKKGLTGLLVDAADSGQGYEIPEALHDELRSQRFDKK